MISKETVREFFASKSIPVQGDVVADSAGDDFIVVVPQTIVKGGGKYPSVAQVSLAISDAEQLGLRIRVVYSDSFNKDVEAGLRALLVQRFGADLRGVFMTMDSSAGHLWLEEKHRLSESRRSEIKQTSDQYLAAFGYSAATVRVLGGGRVPPRSVLGGVVRIKSPINLDSLIRELIEKSYEIPSSSWLKRELDYMRKDGDVLYTSEGCYVLTWDGLLRYGSSKGRNSPDVRRMLDLRLRR